MSTAMICVAPLTRAPSMAEQPTPPAPTTSTDEPGVTLARIIAAPMPVLTPQANPHTLSSGASSATFVAKRSGTTAYSANDAW